MGEAKEKLQTIEEYKILKMSTECKRRGFTENEIAAKKQQIQQDMQKEWFYECTDCFLSFFLQGEKRKGHSYAIAFCAFVLQRMIPYVACDIRQLLGERNHLRKIEYFMQMCNRRKYIELNG